MPSILQMDGPYDPWILSVAIPCYNSEAYMRKCIESLLPGGEDVEMLVIDDGSKDNTADLADEYAREYPDVPPY